MPPLIGIREAIAAKSFHTPPHTLARGDAEAALAKAPLKLEGEFSFGGQEHFYLETQAAWAEMGEAGSVYVSSSTQHPTEIQSVVADVLGETRNKVVVQSPRMGGGFGGKETQGNAFAAMVALASVKTGQPVRIQLDRDLDMMLTGKRHPFYSTFSVGLRPAGHDPWRRRSIYSRTADGRLTFRSPSSTGPFSTSTTATTSRRSDSRA